MITGKQGYTFYFHLKAKFSLTQTERKDYTDRGTEAGICEWEHMPSLKLFCVWLSHVMESYGKVLLAVNGNIYKYNCIHIFALKTETYIY